MVVEAGEHERVREVIVRHLRGDAKEPMELPFRAYGLRARVVLSGIGADELCGGYTRYQAAYEKGCEGCCKECCEKICEKGEVCCEREKSEKCCEKGEVCCEREKSEIYNPHCATQSHPHSLHNGFLAAWKEMNRDWSRLWYRNLVSMSAAIDD